jgi:hypothetical protein
VALGGEDMMAIVAMARTSPGPCATFLQAVQTSNREFPLAQSQIAGAD